MSNPEDFLTAEELLVEVRASGVELEDRTLRYWTSRGLLAKPTKNPFRAADGRVGYYPRVILGTIAEIVRLQAEGWKLEQIRQQLSEPKKRIRVSSHKTALDFSQKYLEKLLKDDHLKARRQDLYSEAGASSDTSRLRKLLVSRLEPIVGRGDAVHAVSTFLLSLSARQTRRLLRKLKIHPSPKDDGPIADWLEGDNLWKNDDSLSRLAEELKSWSGLPRVEETPVLGRRAALLVERLGTRLSHLRKLSPLERKPEAAEIAAILMALKRLAEQAEENAIFLESLGDADS